MAGKNTKKPVIEVTEKTQRALVAAIKKSGHLVLNGNMRKELRLAKNKSSYTMMIPTFKVLAALKRAKILS